MQAIFLIGARASGKTTFGRVLAEALHCNFVDTDVYMQNKWGETVADVVAREGWEGFRNREETVLHEVACPDTVIATGGGMVLRPANRLFMRENGTVFYLYARPEVLAARLEAAPNAGQRPSLTGKPIVEEVAAVLTEREPLYRETASYVLNAEGTLQDALAEVKKLLAG